MNQCKHEWYAKDGDTRGIYRCRICNTTSNVTPMVNESRVREIVREEIGRFNEQLDDRIRSVIKQESCPHTVSVDCMPPICGQCGKVDAWKK